MYGSFWYTLSGTPKYELFATPVLQVPDNSCGGEVIGFPFYPRGSKNINICEYFDDGHMQNYHQQLEEEAD